MEPALAYFSIRSGRIPSDANMTTLSTGRPLFLATALAAPIVRTIASATAPQNAGASTRRRLFMTHSSSFPLAKPSRGTYLVRDGSCNRTADLVEDRWIRRARVGQTHGNGASGGDRGGERARAGRCFPAAQDRGHAATAGRQLAPRLREHRLETAPAIHLAPRRRSRDRLRHEGAAGREDDPCAGRARRPRRAVAPPGFRLRDRRP